MKTIATLIALYMIAAGLDPQFSTLAKVGGINGVMGWTIAKMYDNVIWLCVGSLAWLACYVALWMRKMSRGVVAMIEHVQRLERSLGRAAR